MKVNFLVKALPLIGFLAQDCFSDVAMLSKEILARIHVYEDKEEEMGYWQLIWLQSKANGCHYHDEDATQMKWQWPKNTWLQQRLNHQLRISGLRAARGTN